VTAMVEPVAIKVADRFDDLDGRQRPVVADGVKHADHAIPLEVRHPGAARRDGYFVDAEDHGPAQGIAAIGRARRHEATYASGLPPVVWKTKREPSASALSSGAHALASINANLRPRAGQKIIKRHAKGI
jgi:hypothetical protein